MKLKVKLYSLRIDNSTRAMHSTKYLCMPVLTHK